ncbi:MAG: MarR family winged helix-turn-helix transcriptional regulator, partial [Vicinamibacterales bacterium]
RQAARALTQLYDGRLRRIGMQAPQFALLMTLNGHSASSQIALGRRYGLDKTTVSRNLKWLSNMGWIESSAGGDSRTRAFRLTAEGRRRLAAALPEWKKAQAQLRAALTEEQWHAMFRAFRTVANAARTVHRRRGPARPLAT